MQLSIHHPNLPASPALVSHTESALLRAFSRVADRVAQVAVSITDVNGLRGGPDKRCVLRVTLTSGEMAQVRHTSDCAYAAVHRAADRIRRVVHEKLKRRRQVRRRSVQRRGGPHEIAI